MKEQLEENKDKDMEAEEEVSPPTRLIMTGERAEKRDAKSAFLSSLKYRQQEGDYSFGHTIWRVYEMLWEKFMAWGHLHETDPEVEEELCQDIMAWLSTMSGHGEEETRKERLNALVAEFTRILEEDDSKLRVHKFFNLTGSAAFHHDIGFKANREKTEFDLTPKRVEEIRAELKVKMDAVEEQRSLLQEVQSK